jgi:uncharacterized membrane protein
MISAPFLLIQYSQTMTLYSTRLSKPTHLVRSLRATVLALGLMLSAAVILASPAHADLRLCNTTTGRIGVAIGYQDNQGWATEGWWNIAAQTCETLYKGILSSRFYYIHAVDYDRGGEWAGQSFMCSADKSFTIRGVEDCQKRGHKRTGYFEIDTGESKDWTIRLSDPTETGAKAK